MLEKYVKGDDYKANQMPINTMMFDSIRKVLDENVTKVYGIEYPLWSKRLYTAGTTDMIAEFNGVTSIVDFKTSRKLKQENWIESYFLQSTVYAMMTEARTDLIVPQIAIIIGVDDEPDAQLFVKSSYQFREQVQNIFKK
jgi:ATP-dependent exoDNAse (exonuclease V) beta subunit